MKDNVQISCTNSIKKMKIKSKRNFEVRYSFINLFSQNLEILAPCHDVSSQNWLKKTQIVYQFGTNSGPF